MTLTAKWLKVLSLIILTIVILIVLYFASFYYLMWARQFDDDNWHQLAIYNIRINDNQWQGLDIGLPLISRGGVNKMEYEVAIPNRYRLIRDNYIIEVELNPTKRITQANMQIAAKAKADSGDRYLNIELNWQGKCGELLDSASRFIANKNAVGFAVDPYSSGCLKLIPFNEKLESPLTVSPIGLKIYDGENLIGEEQINLEVFSNGIRKYLVTL